MMGRAIFSALLPASLLLACSIGEPETELKSMIPIDTVVVERPAELASPNYWQLLRIGDQKYFIQSASTADSIHILGLSIPEFQYGFKVSIPFYGDQAPNDGKLTALVHNLDSIFIYSTNRNKLFLFDKDGKIRNNWPLSGEKRYAIKSGNRHTTVFFEDNYLYFAGNVYLNPLNEEFIKENQAVFRLNLLDTIGAEPLAGYPPELGDGYLAMQFLDVNIAPAGRGIEVNFPFSESIYVIDPDRPGEFQSLKVDVPDVPAYGVQKEPVDPNAWIDGLGYANYKRLYKSLDSDEYYRFVEFPKSRFIGDGRAVLRSLEDDKSIRMGLIKFNLDNGVEGIYEIPLTGRVIPTSEGVWIEGGLDEKDGVELQSYILLKE